VDRYKTKDSLTSCRFLWVKLQIAEIFNACIEDGTAHRIPDMLGNLPTKLYKIYRAALLRVYNGDNENSIVARKVLQWVMYARRPMSLYELEDALSQSRNKKPWKELSVKRWIPNLSRVCGNLLSYDESEGVMYLAHHTVLQFLYSGPDISLLRQFYFQPSNAHMYLGKLCVTYLMFSDFEHALTTTKDPSELKYLNQPANLTSLESRNKDSGLLSSAVRLGNSLTTNGKTLDGVAGSNLETRLRSIMLAKNTQSDRHFHLLEYCIRNWHQHCSLFTSEDIEFFTAFHQLVVHQNPPLPWKLWGNSDSIGKLPYWEIFNWAIRHAHRPILHIWRECVSDNIAASSWEKLCIESGERLLSTVCAAANFSQINIPIEYCVEASTVHQIKTDFRGTALCLAARFGYLEIIDRIILSQVDFNKTNTNRCHLSIALRASACVGHLAVVERPIQEKVDINAGPSEYSGRTALQAAAEGGHLAVVRLLQTAGALV
jgi:hypothetical protein